MDNRTNCPNNLRTSSTPPPKPPPTDANKVKPTSQNSDGKSTNQKPGMKKPKEPRKKNTTYQRKYFQPHVPPQKSAPVHVHISNPSAEVVLRERKVEIKDLESQVAYLRNQIKELQVENKTLLDVQARQEKELKKFKAGVADLPSMLRSHKDEIKAVESNAFSLRRELKDCQKDLKAKNDLILRKEQQIDKLNLVLKRNEKHIQEVIIENKELKFHNKKYEEESKKLSVENEELKSKNDWLQKKMQQMTNTILDLEGNLESADRYKNKLKESLSKVQKKCDELLLSEVALKKSLQVSKNTTSTQTDIAETISVSCMTTAAMDEIMGNEKINSSEYEEIRNSGDISSNVGDLPWSIAQTKNTCNDFPFFIFSTNASSTQLDSRVHSKHQIKTPQDSSSIPMKLFQERQDFVYSKVEMENAKQLSAKNFKYQTSNFVNRNLFTKHSASIESKRLQNCDIQDCNLMHTLLDGHSSRSSTVPFLNPKLKHFSNLTLK